MHVPLLHNVPSAVALRKESVDRNVQRLRLHALLADVALRKESVDRNHDGAGGVTIAASRSPQGERG